MFKKLIQRICKFFGARKSNRAPSSQHQEAVDPSATTGDPLAELSGKSPEEICGLHEGMTLDEVDAHLKTLYRRHNRAASSLDEARRAEADFMLDAIVEMRQRYIEPSLR